MSRAPIRLDKRALLLLHRESLAQFGGASGMRDEGLLDAALARPVNEHAYEGCTDVAALAAAHGFALARNHAFVDGNKCVALLAVGVFLAVNGKSLSATPVEAIEAIVALAAGEMDEAALSGWIRDHLREAP